MLTQSVSIAAQAISSGGIVVHATEGVWGLACDPFDDSAVERLLEIKQRPADKGLIVIGASSGAFAEELALLTPAERERVCADWPGPVTWILPGERFSSWVRGTHAGIAVRVPGHPQARALAERAGLLVSTSANIAGHPPVLTEAEAVTLFAEQVDVVLSGAVLEPGAVSRLQTLDGQVLRP